MKPRRILGNTLEGGGQLVRVSICLSALTARPIEIINIRGGRPRGGGLKEQHLTSVKWLAEACDADTEGVALKSQQMLFMPNKNKQGFARSLQDRSRITISLPTPGASTLNLQAVLPFLLFTNLEPSSQPILLTLVGGTNVPFAPSIDYVAHVLFHNLKLVGLPPMSVQSHNLQRGWTTGRNVMGSATVSITPLAPGTTLPAFVLPSFGEDASKILAVLLAPSTLRDTTRKAVFVELARRLPNINDIEFIVDEDSRHDKRFYLMLIAETKSGWRLGHDWLFDRKMPNSMQGLEKVAQDMAHAVVKALASNLKNPGLVDEFMEDQLVIFQALAKGRSRVRPTSIVDPPSSLPTASLHTRTARWVVEEILNVEFEKNGSCEGIGLVAGSLTYTRNRIENDLSLLTKREQGELIQGLQSLNLDS